MAKVHRARWAIARMREGKRVRPVHYQPGTYLFEAWPGSGKLGFAHDELDVVMGADVTEENANRFEWVIEDT